MRGYGYLLFGAREGVFGASARELSGAAVLGLKGDPSSGFLAEWPVRRAGKRKTLYVIMRENLW
jgi:hypothetical protein